jgi:hypothetical protein
MEEIRFQKPLPNANLVLTLSILSLVTCCCFGVTGFVLAAIALVFANKDLKLYMDNPEQYLPSSYSNLSTGRVLSIISLVLNSGMVIMMILKIFFAVLFPFAFMNHWLDHMNCW